MTRWKKAGSLHRGIDFRHPGMTPIRADQLLSRYGYCSRRDAEAWISRDRLTVEDAPVSRADARVDPEAALVDGRPVEFPGGLCVAFHKPVGIVCSHNHADGEIIYDLLPARWMRRNPAPVTAGRLDKETSGLILITDDGALVHRLTSPRHESEKTYEVTVDRDLPPDIVETFASGTLLLRSETRPCLPARCELTGPRTAILHVMEGRYHQVRRMFASQGCTVTALHRTRVGNIALEGLKPGEWRAVTV